MNELQVSFTGTMWTQLMNVAFQLNFLLNLETYDRNLEFELVIQLLFHLGHSNSLIPSDSIEVWCDGKP